MAFFTEIKKYPKIHKETQKTLNIQSNPNKKSTHNINFKLYYRTIVRKIAWYGHKNRCVDQ